MGLRPARVLAHSLVVLRLINSVPRCGAHPQWHLGWRKILGMTFDAFFACAMGERPYEFQRRMALEEWPAVLVAPTGLGKTAAVVIGWLWRRWKEREVTPRRLALCLPMRTLVEQAEGDVQSWLAKLHESGDRWSGSEDLPGPDDVHVLMGGQEQDRGPPAWGRNPERPAILIGTQDMLLSRALMRGYGMSRFRWPVEFALLHTDTQWVFDEVQAMGAGMTTSAQLEGLRPAPATVSACRSLWLSATLEPEWLRTVDHPAPDAVLRVPGDVREDKADPRVTARRNARKRLSPAVARPEGPGRKDAEAYARALAAEVLEAHRPGHTTLVILNTVARAQELYRNLPGTTERLLLHARFRPAERRAAMHRLRSGPAGRIVVATQAIEAGVDITSAVLFTELAPWPSLVQRFGRVNRYGECGEGGAEIRWIDLDDAKGELAGPYPAEELAAARDHLAGLTDAAPANLLPAGVGPAARHVLRRKDLLDLFDSDPDLTGFDIDVSPFIRDARDTDFQVFWRDFAALEPACQPLPRPEELCAVPIRRAAELLKGRRGWRLDPQARRAGKETRAAWVRLDGERVWPGLVVMLDAAAGGYHAELGLLPDHREPVPVVGVPAGAGAADPDVAESHDDDRDTHQSRPVSLTAHLGHVADEAEALCTALGLDGPERIAVVTAARWHDVGKVHEAFQERLIEPDGGIGRPLAKATGYDRTKGRPYFRHELASALAYLRQHGGEPLADLVAYLIAAHHGKVRLSLRALPAETPGPGVSRFARGVWEGDSLLPVDLGDGGRSEGVTLSLDLMELGDGASGPSWAAHTARLLKEHGPFRLAWLEALVRIADWRASDREAQGGYDDDR